MSCLSPEDRALIEAAIAAGKVRRIPRGVSGIPTPVWRDERLVYAEDDPDQIAARKARMFRPKTRPPGPMRAPIIEAHNRGLRPAQIAAELGINETTARAHLNRAGIAINRMSPEERSAQAKRAQVSARVDPKIVARRESVCAMMCAGVRQVEIARRLGVSGDVIHDDVRALRKAGRLPGRRAAA